MTGVGAVQLGTYTYNPNDNVTSRNSTLLPYWYMQVNVNNMPTSGLAGVAVQVSANDGTVASSILVGKPLDFSPVNQYVFVYFAELLATSAIILGVIFVIIGMIIVVNKRKQKMNSPMH